jgi:hypothetical protein
MAGTPTSEHSGPDSNEVASLYATLHGLKKLLGALDVDCRRQAGRTPARSRPD